MKLRNSSFVLRKLRKKYGPETTLDRVSAFRDPFKVLIATVLSQRTRDEVTDEATKRLFARFPTVQALAKAPVDAIATLIKPVGFYPTKARRIRDISEKILKKYRGIVPGTMKELIELHGVGPKTAACVLIYGYGLPAVAVDTHVNRVCQRLGWVNEGTKPEKTQEFLGKHLMPSQKLQINSSFVSFGKDICRPIRPQCTRCSFTSFCSYYRRKLHA